MWIKASFYRSVILITRYNNNEAEILELLRTCFN